MKFAFRGGQYVFVCAGFYRSGSTLLYNMVRLSAEEAYLMKNVYSAWSATFKKQGKQYIVLKTHKYYDPVAAMIRKGRGALFTCDRPREDVQESMRRLDRLGHPHNWGPELMHYDKLRQSGYLRWRELGGLHFGYDDLVGRPGYCVDKILSRMSCGGRRTEIRKIVMRKLKNVRPPEGKTFDEKTLLWSYHMS